MTLGGVKLHEAGGLSRTNYRTANVPRITFRMNAIQTADLVAIGRPTPRLIECLFLTTLLQGRLGEPERHDGRGDPRRGGAGAARHQRRPGAVHVLAWGAIENKHSTDLESTHLASK